MPFNQQQLVAMGVSHESIDSGLPACCLLLCAHFASRGLVVRAGTKYGLPTKLTGAGGGGCAISLIPPDVGVLKVNEFNREMRALGFEVFECVIGQEGALYHFGESVPPVPRDAHVHVRSRL